MIAVSGGGASVGGPQQRARWWYFLFFQYDGVAERALVANDWALFKEFLGSSVSSTVMSNYISQLSVPGKGWCYMYVASASHLPLLALGLPGVVQTRHACDVTQTPVDINTVQQSCLRRLLIANRVACIGLGVGRAIHSLCCCVCRRPDGCTELVSCQLQP